MDYQEALKKVQSTKAKDVFMRIELDYNISLVLSHKDGITLLNALANAEQITDRYGEKPRISGLDKDKIKVYLLSREDYDRIKIAQLLNLTLDDVKNLELQTQEPPIKETTTP